MEKRNRFTLVGRVSRMHSLLDEAKPTRRNSLMLRDFTLIEV